MIFLKKIDTLKMFYVERCASFYFFARISMNKNKKTNQNQNTGVPGFNLTP